MTSSNYNKLWIKALGSATWTEATEFTNMAIDHTLNFVPSLNVIVYDRTGSLASLLVAGNAYRVTDQSSTDGKVATLWDGTASGEGGTGREWGIGTFTPVEDNLGTRTGTAGYIHILRGFGLEHRVSRTTYTSDTEWTATAQNTIVSALITTPGLTAGTIDTNNPSLSMAVRDDKVWGALLDVAGIDGPTGGSFTHYVYCTATNASTGDFTPKVHFRKFDSSIYATVNPVVGVDDGRIIRKDTEARGFNKIREQDRIVNDVKVIYGKTRLNVTASDATSITTYGRRSKVVFAPWIRDSATAQYLADTAVAMLKGDGTSDGILQGIVTLRTADLYAGSDFNANLGDTVSVYDGTNTLITGKFLGWSYRQEDESLTVMIGLPRAPFFEDFADVERKIQQEINAVVTSENNATILDASNIMMNVTSNTTYTGGDVLTNSINGVTLAASAADYTYRFFNNTTSGVDLSAGYGDQYTTIMYLDPQAAIDGPIEVIVALVNSSNTIEAPLATFRWGPMLPSASPVEQQTSYVFSSSTMIESTPTYILVRFRNRCSDSIDTADCKWRVKVYRRPFHAHDMP